MLKTRRLGSSCLVLIGIFIASTMAAAEPTTSEPSTSDAPHVHRKLFFAESSAAETDAPLKRTRDQALKTFAILGALDEFQCRLSEDCLSRPFLHPIGIDVAFQDLILGVPVYGQARVDGALRIDLAPDKDHVSFDIIFTGTVALKGTGRSQGVQIRTDTVVDFSASKRILIDHDGISCKSATCTANAAITTKGISSSRPLLGKFSEQIAKRKSADSKNEAESECAEHLSEAISEHLDREVDAVAAVVNVALADYWKTATPDVKSRWTEIRFNTAEDWVHIARPRSGQEPRTFVAASQGKPTLPIVLQLPRARLDMNVVLTGMRYLQTNSQQPAFSSHVGDQQAVKLHPVLELGPETITIRFEFDELHGKVAQGTPTTVGAALQ
jgi:hypothetical protein